MGYIFESENSALLNILSIVMSAFYSSSVITRLKSKQVLTVLLCGKRPWVHSFVDFHDLRQTRSPGNCVYILLMCYAKFFLKKHKCCMDYAHWQC